MNDADYNIFERQVDITGDDITWEPIESKITAKDKNCGKYYNNFGQKSTLRRVEVKLLKNIFGHLNVGAWTETNLQPQIVNGESTIGCRYIYSVKLIRLLPMLLQITQGEVLWAFSCPLDIASYLHRHPQ